VKRGSGHMGWVTEKEESVKTALLSTGRNSHRDGSLRGKKSRLFYPERKEEKSNVFQATGGKKMGPRGLIKGKKRPLKNIISH